MIMENNNENGSGVRAAIYLRVSTDEQSKEGYGIAYQEERCRGFVSSQDYTLDKKHVFKDEGFSGSLPIDERPGLGRLFEAAKAREFDVILVYKLDRFFRHTALLLDAVDRLKQVGVGFRSATEPFDTSSPIGEFILQNLGSIAQLERSMIKDRMNSGRAMAAKAGKWVLGQAPYGYKINKRTSKLEIVPQEAKWVKKFFGWSVEEQLSLNAILRRVNDLKIPTPFQTRRKKKTSGFWHKRVINRILTNDTYGGTFYFRKHDNQGRLRPETDWIPIRVPEIVPPEMVERAKK